MQRISGLDGIRALAIAFVIGGHILPHHRLPWMKLIFGGQDGVGLFFVLSGFLVTSLLLREHERQGTIDIPHFYFRRALRIVPPLLSYLLVVVCICWKLGQPVPARVIASVLFFYHNMTHEGTWMLEHTWSLAVEEQYYLLWPMVVVLALRRNRRTLIVTSLVLMAFAPFLRIAGPLMHWEWIHHKETYLFPTRMDALLAGSVTACLAGTQRFERAYRRIENLASVAPLFLFVISPWLSRLFWFRYDYGVGFTMNAVVGAYFVLWLSRNERHVLGRIANWKPIATVGVMSYSIYLWQTMGAHYSDGIMGVILGLLFICVMTCASFYLVERPAAAARSYAERVWFRKKSSQHVESRGNIATA